MMDKTLIEEALGPDVQAALVFSLSADGAVRAKAIEIPAASIPALLLAMEETAKRLSQELAT